MQRITLQDAQHIAWYASFAIRQTITEEGQAKEVGQGLRIGTFTEDRGLDILPIRLVLYDLMVKRGATDTDLL